MDWVKNLNLHLENLLPGIVVFFLAALLVSTADAALPDEMRFELGDGASTSKSGHSAG